MPSFELKPESVNQSYGWAASSPLSFGFRWFCRSLSPFVRLGIFAMAKSKKKVETLFLVCEETGDYNYTVRKKPGGEKLKLMKYSPKLRKHTVHNEKKK
jgi:large subunit ribosomal protein L33